MKKRLLITVLILLVLTVFFGCNRKPDTPESVVKEFFTDLKKLAYDDTSKYIDTPLFKDMGDVEKELLGYYFATFDVEKPILISQEEHTAVVSVQISAVDMITIGQNFFTELSRKASEEGFDPNTLTDELINKQLIDAITATDAIKKSMTLEVNMVLLEQNGKKHWIITVDDSLRAGLFLQSPGEGYSDIDGGIEDFEIVEVKSSKAIYISEESVTTGFCVFNVGGETMYMYCEDSQFEELEKSYKDKGKGVNIAYDVLAKPSEPDMTLYKLNEIKK